MPDWLDRTTMQFIGSKASADLPKVESEYIEYPDLSNVDGIDKKYWIILGDTITEMNQSGKDAVDLAILTASRNALADRLDNTEEILRALTLVIKDEINILRDQHSLPDRTIAQLKIAIRNKLGN